METTISKRDVSNLRNDGIRFERLFFEINNKKQLIIVRQRERKKKKKNKRELLSFIELHFMFLLVFIHIKIHICSGGMKFIRTKCLF